MNKDVTRKLQTFLENIKKELSEMSRTPEPGF